MSCISVDRGSDFSVSAYVVRSAFLDFSMAAGGGVLCVPSVPPEHEIAHKAGAGSELLTYLRERGIRSVGALALVAGDRAAF